MSRPGFGNSRCFQLRALMFDQRWHSQDELQAAGGRRYGARLWDIARGVDGRAPMAVDRQDISEGVFNYRLRDYAPGEPIPTVKRETQAQRLVRLEKELQEARAELARLRSAAQASFDAMEGP